MTFFIIDFLFFMEQLQKVVLLGDTNVGKTAIAQRFNDDSFDINISSTVASSSFVINRNLDNKQIKFNLLDTAGQERYKSLTPLYFQNADVILLVYDITSIESFHSLESWHHMVEERGPKEVKFVIIGNKADLLESSNPYLDETLAFATKIGAQLSTVSAKTGEGINTLLLLIEHIISEIKESQENTVSITPKANQANNCNC